MALGVVCGMGSPGAESGGSWDTGVNDGGSDLGGADGGRFASVLEVELTRHLMSCLWRDQETGARSHSLVSGGTVK